MIPGKRRLILMKYLLKGKVVNVYNYKYLGTTIDYELTWKDHIDSLFKKMYSRLKAEILQRAP